MKFNKKNTSRPLQETGLQILAFNFNAAGNGQGYKFVLNNFIKIYAIQCSFTCNIQFLDLIGASIDNSIFNSITSTGATGLVINEPNNTSFYQFPANFWLPFTEPLIVKTFVISRLNGGINTYFYYKNYIV